MLKLLVTAFGLRFSLRTLLLATTLLCVSLGRQVEQASRRLEAISRIEALGGTCYLRHEVNWEPETGSCSFHVCNLSADAFRSKPAQTRSLRLQDILDGGAQLRPDVVFLGGTAVSDEDVQLIASLGTVRILGLSDTKIGPNGFAALKSMHSLCALNLSNTAVSNDDLRSLSGCTNLVTLEINQTEIDENGLKHLPHESLRRLGMWRTLITDDGLEELLRFGQLQSYVVGSVRKSETSRESFRTKLNARVELLTAFFWR